MRPVRAPAAAVEGADARCSGPARAPAAPARWRARSITARRATGCGWTQPSRTTRSMPSTGPATGRSRSRWKRTASSSAAAADDDAVLFHRDLDRPVAGPVLGIDRVVLDGWVQPQPVALLAVIERALQRAGAAGARAGPEHLASAPSTAAAGARTGRILVVLLGLALGRLGGLLLGFGLGTFGLQLRCLELGCDQCIVLSAQVDLVGILGDGCALCGILLDQIVLTLELFDVAHADLELMGDPGVGTALTDPGADLVEVRAQ